MNEDLGICYSQYMTAREERIDGPKSSLIIFCLNICSRSAMNKGIFNSLCTSEENCQIKSHTSKTYSQVRKSVY